jgi:hypothetical protein
MGRWNGEAAHGAEALLDYATETIARRLAAIVIYADPPLARCPEQSSLFYVLGSWGQNGQQAKSLENGVWPACDHA